jgi:hypothetical protein
MRSIWEEIVVLAGEGGRVTLLGARGMDGTWMFTKETNEAVLADILEDEDLSAHVRLQSKIVKDWGEAMKLLGRSWIYLRPRYVHPEFRQLIWDEIRSREEVISLIHWERLCLTEND